MMHAIDYARLRAAGGPALAFLGALAAMAAAGGRASAAPAETVLHSFAGGAGDGGNPQAGLLADSSGNFYGTTNSGGALDRGVVFKLAPDGTNYKVLFSICSANFCKDGAFPVAGLIADGSGNLYGTTVEGGPNANLFAAGNGVVFRLAPDGTGYKVLYSFCSKPNCSDGAFPVAGLIADSSGNLYGTASQGGASETECAASGCGVVFKLAPDGSSYQVLHSFAGGTGDGAAPAAGLIADSSGNLYGTAEVGGASGEGVVFKLAPDGSSYQVLHSFAGGAGDGAISDAGLIADRSGNLYGTTEVGGASGEGVVFKLAPDGSSYQVLHSFCSLASCSDGADPEAGLIADGSGNLYGTTREGGASSVCPGGCGTVFKLAGTGFVTTTPFLAFNPKLEFDVDLLGILFIVADTLEADDSFTLSSANGNNIHPATDPVTFTAGPFSVTIPPGSFVPQGGGNFAFAGQIGGKEVKASISPTGTLRYDFMARVEGVNGAGIKNPVPVGLTIGQNGGTASVNATFDYSLLGDGDLPPDN